MSKGRPLRGNAEAVDKSRPAGATRQVSPASLSAMPRFILPVLLGALLLGAVGFGAAQLTEAKKLRASLAALDQERADLRKRVWELQKLNGELAARRERGPVPSSVANGPADNRVTPDVQSAGTGRPQFDGNRLNTLLNNPEMQHLIAIQQKAGLDGNYAALFKKLNLSPAELEKFKSLLVEKQSTLMDVMAAARSQGLTGRDSRDEIRQLMQDAQAEVDATIRSTLGEDAYSHYKNYETTLPLRGVVDQLAQRLSYSTTPLNEAQAEQLVQILAVNAAPTNSAGNRPNTAAPLVQAFAGNARFAQATALVGGTATLITDTAVTQAQSVLAPQQIAALQSLQQEQQAAAQLLQQMRATGQERRQGSPTTQPIGPGGG